MRAPAPGPLPPVPTARGIGLLLAGLVVTAAGATTRRSELLWFGVVLIALVLTSLGYGLARAWWDRRLRITRVLRPAQLQVGRMAAMDLAFTSPVPPWSRLTDRIPPHTRRTGTGTSATIEPLRRGPLRLGPVLLSASDPFALARWRRIVGASDDVLVWPRTDAIDVDTAWGDVSLAQRRAGHPSGDLDDATLREYRPGDPLERVHWKVSARHSTMLVRQEDPAEAELFHVVLAPGGADAATTDRLVDVAASLLAHVHEQGWALRLWLPDAGGQLTERAVADLGESLSELAVLAAGEPVGEALAPPGSLEGTVLLVLGGEGPAAIDALCSWAARPGAVHLPAASGGAFSGRFERAGWAVREI